MSIKFSDTQLAMMRAAAERDDRCLAPPPSLKGVAAQKVAAKLIAAKLAKDIKAKAGSPVWRYDAEFGQPFALRLTAAGLKVIAVDKETAAVIDSEGPPSPEEVACTPISIDPAARPKHPNDAAPRKGSKLAAVVGMLRRNQGATVGDLTAATGWLPHTTRAAITGLRKRGYSVICQRIQEGGSAYRISDGPAGGSDALSGSPEAASSPDRREPEARQAV
jgi:hypothetical protein